MANNKEENEFVLVSFSQGKFYEKLENGFMKEIKELRGVIKEGYRASYEVKLLDENIAVEERIEGYPYDTLEWHVYVKNKKGKYESLTEEYPWMNIQHVGYEKGDIHITYGSGYTNLYYTKTQYGYEMISASEYGTGIYNSLKESRKEELKKRPKKIYQEDGFFMSEDFNFYHFKKEDKKIYYDEIKPVQKFEFAELYEVKDKLFLVSKMDDERQLVLGDETGKISEYVFLDDDFAYAAKYEENTSWFFLKRQKDGSYEDMNRELLKTDKANINYFTHKEKLLFISASDENEQELSLYYMKDKEGYSQIDKKQAITYLNSITSKSKKPNKEILHWQPVSNLGKSINFNILYADKREKS